MRFGVISDTHDRVPAINKAVDMLNELAVDATLHCGDFISPFALRPFERLTMPLYAVYGNNDGERGGLATLFEKNGWFLHDRPTTITIQGKTVSMLHEPWWIDNIIADKKPDLLVYGHTHEMAVDQIDGTVVVNPGEGCGYVKGKPTFAVVDLLTGASEFMEIEL